MDSPGAAFIGLSLVGAGGLMIWAAYKNVQLLGPNGVVTQTIQKGKVESEKPIQRPVNESPDPNAEQPKRGTAVGSNGQPLSSSPQPTGNAPNTAFGVPVVFPI